MQGYWQEDVMIDNHLLFRLKHSTSPKEQALMLVPVREFAVMPIDLDLDGRYDIFLVLSTKAQKLADVLVVTPDGWLRHSTQEEFEAQEQVGESNRRSLERAKQLVPGLFNDL
jgi:hypothetical protein